MLVYPTAKYKIVQFAGPSPTTEFKIVDYTPYVLTPV